MSLKQLTAHTKATYSSSDEYYLGNDTNPKRVPHPKHWIKVDSTYKPFFFNAPFLTNPQPVWADPMDVKSIDFDKRFEGLPFIDFIFDENGYPLNPIGPTGLAGRGVLGKWGPNTAADPLVTRWKRDDNGEVVCDGEGNQILQFVGIRRTDNGEVAIPGGMVDPGEKMSQAAQREFGEEAMNSLEKSPEQVKAIKEQIAELFSHSRCIYEGYVDDPRNTDNAWMVTRCYHTHDESGEIMNNFNLEAGDDAGAVFWVDYSPSIDVKLYASHITFVQQAYHNLTYRHTFCSIL